MSSKLKNILSLILNIAILVLVTICFVGLFVSGGDGNMKVLGVKGFRYFTIDSNILMGLVSLLFIPFNILVMIKKDYVIPKIVYILKFTGTVAVTVTFLTVMFFLGPLQGYDIMLEGNNLFMHLITPLLAIVSVFLFENVGKMSVKETLYGSIPTVIYSFVYTFMVAIISKWRDFYGFTFGGKYYLIPVSLIAMYGLSFGIGIGLYKLSKLVNKEK